MNQKRYELDDTNRKWEDIFWLSVFTYRFLLVSLIALLIYNGMMEIAIAIILYNSMSKVTDFIKNSGLLIKTIKGFNLSCDRIFSIMDEKIFSKEKFGKLHLDAINGDFTYFFAIFLSFFPNDSLTRGVTDIATAPPISANLNFVIFLFPMIMKEMF